MFTFHNTLSASNAAYTHPVKIGYARLERPNGGGMDDRGIVRGTSSDGTICTAIQINVIADQAGDEVVHSALRLQTGSKQNVSQKREKRKIYAGMCGLWEALDRPMVSWLSVTSQQTICSCCLNGKDPMPTGAIAVSSIKQAMLISNRSSKIAVG